jgi:hypothetical protein
VLRGSALLPAHHRYDSSCPRGTTAHAAAIDPLAAIADIVRDPTVRQVAAEVRARLERAIAQTVGDTPVATSA